MIKEWTKISEAMACRGNIFSYWQVESQSADGRLRGVFDVLKFSNWVNVLAITPDQKMVIAQQFRQGTQEITLELPGGAVERGEPFLKAAQRELKEETGYESSHWKLLGQVDPNPAMMSNTCQTYLALQCEKTAETSFDPLEEITTELYPVKEIPALVERGQIKHSLVIAAFYLWSLHRLREEV